MHVEFTSRLMADSGPWISLSPPHPLPSFHPLIIIIISHPLWMEEEEEEGPQQVRLTRRGLGREEVNHPLPLFTKLHLWRLLTTILVEDSSIGRRTRRLFVKKRNMLQILFSLHQNDSRKIVVTITILIILRSRTSRRRRARRSP